MLTQFCPGMHDHVEICKFGKSTQFHMNSAKICTFGHLKVLNLIFNQFLIFGHYLVYMR